MESQTPSFSAIVSLLLFLFMVANLVWRSISNKYSNPKLPPGPRKLPIIGNMHQLMSGSSPPHHKLRNLAMIYGPLMHLQLGEVSNIIVSSPEIARECLKTHDTIFANRPLLFAAKIITYGFKGISFSQYGDYWRQLRKICSMELLSAKRVKSFRSIREEEVSNLITTIRRSCSQGSATPVDLTENINLLNYGLTARTAFGKKTRDQEAYISVAREMSRLAGGFYISDMYPSIKMLRLVGGLRRELVEVHAEADRILGNILRDHKEKRMVMKTRSNELAAADDHDHEEDLVDVLLKFQEGGQLDYPLTDSNIKAVLLVRN